jgi:TonB family protein
MSPDLGLEARKQHNLSRKFGKARVTSHKNIPCRHSCVFRPGATIALLALLFLLPKFAHAESALEKQLKFDYLEKALTLRHFYSGDRLKFRPDGTLQGDAVIGPWTLDGQIEVEDVRLHGAQLLIKGRRIRRTFDAQNNPVDQLAAVANKNRKEDKDLVKDLQHLKVEIEIDLPTEKPEEKEIAPSIHAVFLTRSDFMMDVMPSYWQAYFAKREGRPAPAVKEATRVIKLGGAVSPPHVNYAPDPPFSDEARKAKYQGTVVVSLVVDASGSASDLQIVRPLGLGLDEKAIEAISTWKFKPAEKDGEPVPAAIMVEVNFHLY